MGPAANPTRHGTFVSNAGYLATRPVIARPRADAGPTGAGPASDVWLHIAANDQAPISAAFLYWGWQSSVVRPGQDLVRAVNSSRSGSIGGQAVGHRRDPQGQVDLVVYRADLTRMLQAPCDRRRLHREGLQLRGEAPLPGERALTPSLVVLLEQEDSAITWMFDGASASGRTDRRPFSGLDSCCHGGVEYVLQSPRHCPPSLEAHWTSIALTGSMGFDRGQRLPRYCSEVGVSTYDVTDCLGLNERWTQLAVGQRNASVPRGSTSTTLVDLIWIH